MSLPTLAELQTRTYEAPELPPNIDKETVGAYFEDFLRNDTECPRCAAATRWDWGVIHGEAHCISCGYPGRVWHTFVLSDGTQTSIAHFLFYHPKMLKEKKRDG